VPDLDLDADGTATLDFGARRFVVTFDEELRPIVKGDDGARLATFPRGNKSDDKERVKEASARFKALKADAETVAQSLLRRFEAAMVRGRTWRADVFREHVLQHPLVTHLARRLLWKHGDIAFRVAEDGSLADREDAECTLPDRAIVTLPHPIRLGADVLGPWSTVFADYAIVQPFAQLGRDTYALDDEERGATKLARFDGKRAKPGPLLGSLDARGWQKYPDETSLSSCAKVVRKKSGGEAHVSLGFSPGIDLGDVAGSDDQMLDAPVLRGAGAWSEIDDVDVSELVRDLESFAR
jgi:hypothetical protein